MTKPKEKILAWYFAANTAAYTAANATNATRAANAANAAYAAAHAAHFNSLIEGTFNDR